ncbi:hypothetical protein GQ53DRAFT_653494 [Thozetella sp. PMI_491]|nr:hypothetical protein GQ53DRAFT_653494 [Thozetella sp. PMI_491]
MDSDFHKARLRFKQPKQCERKTPDKVRWRRILERNPYAQALATPVRRCVATNACLPKFFLQDFGLQYHPETRQSWLVPPSLAPRGPALSSPNKGTAPSPGRSEASSMRQPRSPLLDGAADGVSQEPGSSGQGEQLPSRNVRGGWVGPKNYTLARQDLLKAFQITGSGYWAGHKRLFRMHRSPQLASALSPAIWRTDMDTFVLELMRRRIAEHLLHYASQAEDKKGGLLIRCDSYDDARAVDQRGCLVWLGPSGAASKDNPNGAALDAQSRLATMRIDNGRLSSKLAVHNLRILLGEEHVQRLRENSRLFREGSLFLLHGRRATLGLQSKLWKLQGYMV